jgi:hypothetical protein
MSSGSTTSVPDDLAPSTETVEPESSATSEEKGPALPEAESAAKPEVETGT